MKLTSINLITFSSKKPGKKVNTKLIPKQNKPQKTDKQRPAHAQQTSLYNKIENGIKMGRNLCEQLERLVKNERYQYLTTFDNVATIVKKYSKGIIDVKNTSELPQDIVRNFGNKDSYMAQVYDKNNNLRTRTIFLPNISGNTEEIPEYVANAAAEYTRALQTGDCGYLNGIRKYCKHPENAKTIEDESRLLMNEMCEDILMKTSKPKTGFNKISRTTISSHLTQNRDIKVIAGKNDYEKRIQRLSTKLAKDLNEHPQNINKAVRQWITRESYKEYSANSVAKTILKEHGGSENSIKDKNTNKAIYAYIYRSI